MLMRMLQHKSYHFVKNGTICILSANGMVSNATLRQSDSSAGTLTYEIIVRSSIPITPPEVNPKKLKVQQPPSAPTPFTITTPLPPPWIVDNESCNGQGHNGLVSPMQNLTSQPPFQRKNWPHTHSMQERRTSTNDMNISLPERMQ